jgi:uncharacterized tellurite resistance protein B-like protein
LRGGSHFIPKKTIMAIHNKPVTIIESKDKRINFFQNLLIMAVADGYLDEEEEDFLVQIGDQLGLSMDDVTPLAEKGVKSLSFTIPENDQDKLFELQTMVMMMVEDGEVHDREYNLCAQYADRIGLNRVVLDDFVQKLSA